MDPENPRHRYNKFVRYGLTQVIGICGGQPARKTRRRQDDAAADSERHAPNSSSNTTTASSMVLVNDDWVIRILVKALAP